jgi:hypothetical protein
MCWDAFAYHLRDCTRLKHCRPKKEPEQHQNEVATMVAAEARFFNVAVNLMLTNPGLLLARVRETLYGQRLPV